MEPTTTRSIPRAIALGILICGTLDIADALLFFGLHSHVPPMRLLQNIATSLFGKSAFTGGTPTALLGLLIHYLIATVWVVLFVLSAQRIHFLFRQPILAGALYGLIVYVIMNFIAVPLTRIGPRPSPTGIVLVNAVLALVFFIGIAVALINQRYAPIPQP
jgi:uncharacterized membrane protein YagU involved in acid resistance